MKEAREQQAATAEILKVIASSPDDVQPVFDAIAASANRLMGGHSAAVFRFIDGISHLKAFTPTTPQADDVLKNAFPRPISNFALAQRNVLNGETSQIPDTETGNEYQITIARARGFRSIMFSPLMHQGTAIGMITITRSEPGRFADHHVQLLRTFADQAVMAIENERLFNETKETLERQTATAEVLQVINSSPGNLAPVFEAILQKALGLCDAAFGILWTYDGERLHAAALQGVAQAHAEFLTRAPHPVGQNNAHARLLRGETVVHIADVAEDEAYQSGDPIRRNLVEEGGGRTLLAVPLRKDKAFLGDFVIYRQTVKPFSEKEVSLLQNFAAQAVIAMENARLLDELRQSLHQQTATADVLKVISRSTFDLQTVLDALVQSAVQLCEADTGHIARPNEAGFFQTRAHYGFTAELKEEVERIAFKPGRESVAGRALLERKTVQILDAQTDPEYKLSKAQKIGGFRSLIGVPLLREGTPIGVFGLARLSVRPFTEKQITLLNTFADQAVIAIENARLFEEVQARTRDLTSSLEQQTATSEVLQVISSSPGELEPVFQAMLANATRLCEASFGVIWLRDGDAFRSAAIHGALPTAYIEQWRTGTLYRPGPHSGLATMKQTRRPVQMPDLREARSYLEGDVLAVTGVELGVSAL